MHYIRFLKPPRLVSTPYSVLAAKITVTTDLGESFLFADITLIVDLESQTGSNILGPGNGKEYTWKGSDGIRSLEVSIPVPASKRKELLRMVIRPKESKYHIDNFNLMLLGSAVPGDDEGLVVAVRSMDIDVSQSAGQKRGVGMAKRVFSLGGKSVPICEETGESIARHIWDAGLMLSAYLATISSLNTSSVLAHSLPKLPLLKQKLSLKNINVLELGAGCGIVGITLSTFYPNTSQIHLTDLPEASDILTHNISLIPQSHCPAIAHEVLDWSASLPPKVKDANWDLVLVADCTYNPSAMPDLVSTLRGVASGSQKEVVVLLAMKVRHDSEMVCFDILAEAGFVVREKAALPLPLLAGEAEEIEIFVLTLKVWQSEATKSTES